MSFNLPPVEVTLLGNDPGDSQWSMLHYGEALLYELSVLLGPSSQIHLIHPDSQQVWEKWRRFRLGRAAATYGSRYLLYPHLLKKRPPGITHILDQGNSLLIRYLDPSKTVITCHDLIPLIFRKQIRSLWPWISKAAYRQSLAGLTQAAAIIANSPCTRRDILSWLGYPSERVHVIPLGLDPLLKPPSTPNEVENIRATFRLPEGKLLLHVGNTAFYKNIEGLLQGLKIILDRKEPVWLIRAGHPLGRSQRRLAQRLGVINRIVQWPVSSRAHLRQLYQASDLLVHPSLYEGLGLPPLEAMACGLPVVVSNRGALPETVGDAALIIDPEDPVQLADASQRILHDLTLQESLRARGFIQASLFRWETTARKTLAVYQLLPS